MTIGMVLVACLAAEARNGPGDTMTSTLSRTSSAASAGSRSAVTFRPAVLDDEVLPLDLAQLAETLSERLDARGHSTWVRVADVSDARRGLPRRLRPAGERRGEHAQSASDEGSPVHYWITSSARASTAGGIVRPSAFAVLRLITSSNLVGCSTGRVGRLGALQDLVQRTRPPDGTCEGGSVHRPVDTRPLPTP